MPPDQLQLVLLSASLSAVVVIPPFANINIFIMFIT